jgi:hypothetical protein
MNIIVITIIYLANRGVLLWVVLPVYAGAQLGIQAFGNPREYAKLSWPHAKNYAREMNEIKDELFYS